MPTTGWTNLLIGEQELPGDIMWDDPSLALGTNVDHARCSMEDGDFSYALILRSPDFVLPSPITVNGISYRIEYTHNSGGSFETDWSTIRPLKGGVAVGDELALDGSLVSGNIYEFGGDLLGTTWERSDFDSDFGIYLIATAGGLPGQSGSARVYTAQVNLDYTIETVYATGDIALPGLNMSGEGKTIGSADITLPGLTMKAHKRF